MRISRFYTNKPRLKKTPSPKCDPQKHRVYGMEREFIGTVLHTTVETEVLEDILTHACKKHEVSEPALIVYEKAERVFGFKTAAGIFLNASYHGVNLGVMLHELAHWILDEKYTNVADHGPEFCLIYRDLLDQYKILNKDCFDLLAESWGIEVEAR